jgi:hypothetical protein
MKCSVIHCKEPVKNLKLKFHRLTSDIIMAPTGNAPILQQTATLLYSLSQYRWKLDIEAEYSYFQQRALAADEKYDVSLALFTQLKQVVNRSCSSNTRSSQQTDQVPCLCRGTPFQCQARNSLKYFAWTRVLSINYWRYMFGTCRHIGGHIDL